jgi:hypothetical protein
MKSLFLRTCHEKVHWIGAVLDVANDDAIRGCRPEVYHHLRLARLILRMKRESYGEKEWWRELKGIDGKVLGEESAMKLCHDELMRQMKICEFLLPLQPFNDQIFQKNLLLPQLLTLQVDFSIESYENLRNLLAATQNPSETRLLDQYMIVKLYLDVIQAPEPSQDFLESHLHCIRELLKSVDDGEILCQLMQTVLTLLFLRFEHIRKTKRKRKNSEARSGSQSNQNNSHATDVSDATVDAQQNGFVCLKMSLKAILNSMRRFLMNHKSSEGELRGKFEEILRIVDNALWRLTIVESDVSNPTKSLESVKEFVKFHEPKSPTKFEVTSDEDKTTPKKKVNRKKMKKRPRSFAKSDENDEASDDPIDYQLVTETSVENSEIRTQSRSTESQKRVRSVITKVLMSPESLVAVCMLKGDEENVGKIIKVSFVVGLVRLNGCVVDL